MKKRTIGKRIGMLLLTLCLMVTMLPINGTLAFEEGEVPNADAEARYSVDGGANWEYGSLLDVIWACYGKANVQIELCRNITLTADRDNPSNGNWTDFQTTIGYSDTDWTIDGKGCTITRGEGVNCLFAVNTAGSTVTLKDITIDGGAKWSSDDPQTRTNDGISMLSSNAQLILIDNGAQLILEEKTILQNNDLGENFYGAAVMIDNSNASLNKLVMKNGAKIVDNRAHDGGAVAVLEGGSFVIEGGVISGNSAALGGGAIYNAGTMEMTGGEISGNYAKAGGGAIYTDGTMRMIGGVIQHNTSGNISGGMFVAGGTFHVSGNPKIIENTAKNAITSNVHLYGDNKITISDALTEGAFIGVTSGTIPTEENPVDIISGTNAANYSMYFHSDSESYAVVDHGSNMLQLIVHPAHSLSTDYEANATEHWQVCTVCGEALETAEHTWGQWNITKAATTSEAGEKERSCDVCSYKETEAIPKLTDTPPSGSSGHVHTFGPEWKSDELGHWQVCWCGIRRNRIAHTAGEWIVDKAATATADGSRHQACETCGYVMKTEVIPATGETQEQEAAEKQALIKRIQNSRFVARSNWTLLHGKRAVKVRWYNPAGSDNVDLDVYDGFTIFRSIKRYSGYKKTPIFTTENDSYINNKDLQPGTRYFYKVRGYKTIDGKKYYSQWSLKAWRKIWHNLDYYR